MIRGNLNSRETGKALTSCYLQIFSREHKFAIFLWTRKARKITPCENYDCYSILLFILYTRPTEASTDHIGDGNALPDVTYAEE